MDGAGAGSCGNFFLCVPNSSFALIKAIHPSCRSTVTVSRWSSKLESSLRSEMETNDENLKPADGKIHSDELCGGGRVAYLRNSIWSVALYSRGRATLRFPFSLALGRRNEKNMASRLYFQHWRAQRKNSGKRGKRPGFLLLKHSDTRDREFISPLIYYNE